MQENGRFKEQLAGMPVSQIPAAGVKKQTRKHRELHPSVAAERVSRAGFKTVSAV
jgi:hypothetical protein